MSRQYILFLLVGGCAAGVNVLSRIGLSLAMSYEAAIVVAHFVGMTVAFSLNKQFVFSEARGGVAAQYTKFTLVNVVSLAQTWCISVGLAYYVFPAIGFFWYAETVAHATAVSTLAVTSYYGHKLFSFSQSKRDGEAYASRALEKLEEKA